MSVTKMPLSVYKLDGAPGEGAVCVLWRGEYLVGRGRLLQCTDKRASRHQALIKVEAQSSSITSMHKNPCFYQSAKGKTIVILQENNPVDIQQGDKFGLFPDKYWFQFRFEPEKGCNTMSDTKTSQDEGNLKRSSDLNSEVVERKQPKFADDYCDGESNQSTDICALKSEIESVMQHTFVESSNPENNSEIAINCCDGSKPKSSVEEVQNKLESNEKDESVVLNGSVDGKIMSSPGNHHDNEVIKTVDCHDVLPNDENVQIAQENHESSNSNGSMDAERNGEIRNANDNSNHEYIYNNSVQENIIHVAEDSTNAQDVQPTNEEEKLSDSEDDEEEENDQVEGPQPDGNASASTKREKCWYGSGCYRKNSKHRSQFSHSGDADYVSDPSDDRPTCSYGANCYRRNKDHRKEYKHPGKPTNRKRKQKKAAPTKKATAQNDESSEDDYDYEDPFLDDGSEDEYEQESWSECDSDENWKDLQSASDDEDTRNLLKEAKRFTRTKK